MSDEQFGAAHAPLADVLPGSGDVRRRAMEWADTQLVAPDLLLAGLTALADELQRRAREVIGLHTGEEVIFELVRAQLGLEVLLGAEADAVGARCLRPLGIAYDIRTATVYRQAEGMLRPIGANIAMLLDDGHSADEMRSYARRWALEDDEFIDAFVESLIDDRWPAYESCYAESLPLCRSFVGGDLDRFGLLLREQLTPADLDG